MSRADLVLSSIKPVLFRDLTLHIFFWKSLSGHIASSKCSWSKRQMAGPNKVQRMAKRFISQK